MSYPILTLIVLSLFAVYALLMRAFLPKRPLIQTAAVMLLLTLIFDNVIIATSIVDYDPDKLLGIRLGVAPIEDFAYTLVAIVLVPSLFNWLRAKL